MEDQNFEFLKIARMIPIGARNIERMRKDVHNTVTAVFGLSGRYSDAEWRFGEIAHDYQWAVCTVLDGMVALCWYTKNGERKIVYDSRRSGDSISLEHVNRVYEVIGYFIKLVYELFPELPEKLKPLIEAGGMNYELFR